MVEYIDINIALPFPKISVCILKGHAHLEKERSYVHKRHLLISYLYFPFLVDHSVPHFLFLHSLLLLTLILG